MSSKELMPLLIQVISSWQVIAVTIAIVLYFLLVFSAARVSGRSRRNISFSSQPKKKKPGAEGPAVVAASPGASTNEELGLEEA